MDTVENNRKLLFRGYEIEYLSSKEDAIKIRVREDEVPVVVNCPQNILAFTCNGDSKDKRVDSLNIGITKLLKSIGKKHSIFYTEIRGKSETILASNNHSPIKILDVNDYDNLIFFNFPSLLFYSSTIKIEYKLGFNLIDLLQIKVSGEGVVGYCGEGEVLEVNLGEGEYAYINPINLIGYQYTNDSQKRPVKIKYSTYGNLIATQNMDKQFKIEGPIKLLMQTQSLSQTLANTVGSNKLKEYFKKIVESFTIPLPF